MRAFRCLKGSHTAIWWLDQEMLNVQQCTQQSHPKCQWLPYGKHNQPQNVAGNPDVTHRKSKGKVFRQAMEPYGYAATQSHGKVATQPSAMQTVARQLGFYIFVQLNSHTTMQPCGHAAKQRCGHWSMEFCSRATTQLYVHGAVPEISQFYSQAIARHLLQMQDRITKYVCRSCQSQKTLTELLFHARLHKGQMMSKTRLLPPRSPHSYGRVGLCTGTQG